MSSKISTLTIQVNHDQVTIVQEMVEQYQREGRIPAFTRLRVKVGKKVVYIEDFGVLEVDLCRMSGLAITQTGFST
jgi:hypothetical protein